MHVKVLSLAVLGALLGGGLAYLLLSALFTGTSMTAFTNVIGLCALCGAALLPILARRFSKTRHDPNASGKKVL
jgi:hypothetical protein